MMGVRITTDDKYAAFVNKYMDTYVPDPTIPNYYDQSPFYYLIIIDLIKNGSLQYKMTCYSEWTYVGCID